MSIEEASQFARSRLRRGKASPATIRGYLCSLANYLAYLRERDPTIVLHSIGTSLLNSQMSEAHSIGEELIVGDSSLSDETQFLEAVQRTTTYLRHSSFGTRTHACLEFMVDTKTRLEQIRQLDLTDLDLEAGQATVGIPGTHLVGKFDLVSQRSVELSEMTVEAVQTYIEHERINSSSDNSCPVFTTPHGRITPSTVRRSIKQAGVDASCLQSAGSPEHPEKPNAQRTPDGVRHLSPNDVWRYAFTQIEDHE